MNELKTANGHVLAFQELTHMGTHARLRCKTCSEYLDVSTDPEESPSVAFDVEKQAIIWDGYDYGKHLDGCGTPGGAVGIEWAPVNDLEIDTGETS